MTDRPNAHDALLGATSELTYEYGITGTGVDAIALIGRQETTRLASRAAAAAFA